MELWENAMKNSLIVRASRANPYWWQIQLALWCWHTQNGVRY
jgi:hypothetical protein